MQPLNPSPIQPEFPPQPAPPPQPTGGGCFAIVREVVETILLTLVIFFAIRFAVENFRIEGQSMDPNFHDGQFLLVNKIVYRLGQPQRGDVMIFHYPLNPTVNYIKRVIGLPGDTIMIRDGLLYVNGTRVPETYCGSGIETNCIVRAFYSFGPTTMGPGEYFVLGDNRPESSDSHFWGPVPAKDIVGKAWVSYWPPGEWGVINDDWYAVGD